MPVSGPERIRAPHSPIQVETGVKITTPRLFNFSLDNMNGMCKFDGVRNQCSRWTRAVFDFARSGRVYLGTSFRRSANLSGFFIYPSNHADSTANAAARSDNQRHLRLETGVLKEADGSYCHCLSSVNHAGVTARGFRLVKVEPRDSKNAEACPIFRIVQSNRNPMGFCLQPNRTLFSISPINCI